MFPVALSQVWARMGTSSSIQRSTMELSRGSSTYCETQKLDEAQGAGADVAIDEFDREFGVIGRGVHGPDEAVGIPAAGGAHVVGGVCKVLGHREFAPFAPQRRDAQAVDARAVGRVEQHTQSGLLGVDNMDVSVNNHGGLSVLNWIGVRQSARRWPLSDRFSAKSSYNGVGSSRDL